MEWFCTTSFRSDVFQMGLLSALEQFLCSSISPPPPMTHTYTHTISFFILLFPFWKKKGVKEELITLAEFRTHHQCLRAEVFDLIHNASLHCELNRTQIKKLAMLKISGVRGQLFHPLLHLAPYNRSRFFNIFFHFVTTGRLVRTTPALLVSVPAGVFYFLPASLPPLLPQWSRSTVSVSCTNSFTPIFYLAFHYYLLLLFHLL